MKLLLRLSLVAGLFLYLIFWKWAYVNFISPKFGYMGYIYELPLDIFELMAWGVALLPGCWMPIRIKRPSQVIYWILYVLVILPSPMIFLYTLDTDPFELLWQSFFLTINFGLVGLIYQLPLLRLPRIKLSMPFFLLILGALSVFFFSYIISVFGLRLTIPFANQGQVYDLRAQYRTSLSQEGALVAYFITWQAKVVNIFFMARGLILNNLFILGLGVSGQLLLFAINGSKSILFSVILLILLLVALQFKRKYFGLFMVYGLVFMVPSVVATDFLLNTDGLFTSFLLRRVFTGPGLLTGYYFQFFTENPKAWLGHSIFNSLVDYPYHLSPPRLIGYVYFRHLGSYEALAVSANANIWADAYANFGYGGIFVFNILLASLLWLFDSLAKNRDIRLACLLGGISALSVAEAALLTSILTHGIGLTLLLLYLLPKEKNTNIALYSGST